MCLSNQDISLFHIQVSKSERLMIIMLSHSSFKKILYRIYAILESDNRNAEHLTREIQRVECYGEFKKSL